MTCQRTHTQCGTRHAAAVTAGALPLHACAEWSLRKQLAQDRRGSLSDVSWRCSSHFRRRPVRPEVLAPLGDLPSGLAAASGLLTTIIDRGRGRGRGRARAQKTSTNLAACLHCGVCSRPCRRLFPAGASVMAPPLSAPRSRSSRRERVSRPEPRSRSSLWVGTAHPPGTLCPVGGYQLLINFRHKKPSMPYSE